MHQVAKDMENTVKLLYHRGQFLGFSGSSGSKSTSKSGSRDPLVATEVPVRKRERFPFTMLGWDNARSSGSRGSSWCKSWES